MRSLLFLTVPVFSILSSAHPHEYNGSAHWGKTEAQYRADAVKEAFQFAWDGYYQYAFPNDELLPVNNSFGNSRNGWGASAVDAFSTAILMELPDIVSTILQFVPSVDFSVSKDDEEVSLFETTIRYIGGILSGYDLLTGPYKNMINDTSDVDALLDQAKNLANYLSYAFDTPTGIPYNTLYLNNRSFAGSDSNGLATIGTLVLEWTRLSDLTSNDTYTNLTQKAESYLLNPSPESSQPFPGLLGTDVNITTGEFLDAAGGWGGSDDSFYEYLIKSYVYDSSRFSAYKDRWVVAADSSIEHLASHPSTRPDLTFLSNFNGTELLLTSSHLACFDGGNFILGGLVLGEQKYVDFGLELVAGCHDTYAATLTGIGPETFSWNASGVPGNQTNLYETAGFFITDGSYILRPEVIESFYYAYRATGNTTYQDWAWNAFVAVNTTTRVGSGFSEISNVEAGGGGGFKNFQDSFVFAELLKYAYLIHADDALVQVRGNGTQDWVLNTEGHPLKVRGPQV